MPRFQKEKIEAKKNILPYKEQVSINRTKPVVVTASAAAPVFAQLEDSTPPGSVAVKTLPTFTKNKNDHLSQKTKYIDYKIQKKTKQEGDDDTEKRPFLKKAILAFVLSILSIVLLILALLISSSAWLIIYAFFSILVFIKSIASLSLIKRTKQRGKAFAIISLIISSLSILLISIIALLLLIASYL